MRYRRTRSKGGTYFFTEDLRRHVEYIHYNPVKHGLTKTPGDWDFSSFHRYVEKGMYDIKWGAGVKIKFDTTVGYE